MIQQTNKQIVLCTSKWKNSIITYTSFSYSYSTSILSSLLLWHIIHFNCEKTDEKKASSIERWSVRWAFIRIERATTSPIDQICIPLFVWLIHLLAQLINWVTVYLCLLPEKIAQRWLTTAKSNRSEKMVINLSREKKIDLMFSHTNTSTSCMWNLNMISRYSLRLHILPQNRWYSQLSRTSNVQSLPPSLCYHYVLASIFLAFNARWC